MKLILVVLRLVGLDRATFSNNSRGPPKCVTGRCGLPVIGLFSTGFAARGPIFPPIFGKRVTADYSKISPWAGPTPSFFDLLSFIGTIFVPTEQKRCKRLAKLILQTKFSARTGFMRGTFAGSLVEADA